MNFKIMVKLLLSLNIVIAITLLDQSCIDEKPNPLIADLNDDIAKSLYLYGESGNSLINQYVYYDPPNDSESWYSGKYEIGVGINKIDGEAHPNFDSINFRNLVDANSKAQPNTFDFLTKILKVNYDHKTNKFDLFELNNLFIKLIPSSYVPKPIIHNSDINGFDFRKNSVIIQIMKHNHDQTTTILATYRVKVAGRKIKFDSYTRALTWQEQDLTIPENLLDVKTYPQLQETDVTNKIVINQFDKLSPWGTDYFKLAEILNIKTITFKVFDDTKGSLLKDNDYLTIGDKFSLATMFDGILMNHNRILGKRS